MILNGNCSQKYHVSAGVLQDSIPSPRFSYHTLMMIQLPTVSVMHFWFVAVAPTELESDLQDTVGCGKKLFGGFNAGKAQRVSFDHSNNYCAIDMKIDGSTRLWRKMIF